MDMPPCHEQFSNMLCFNYRNIFPALSYQFIFPTLHDLIQWNNKQLYKRIILIET